MQRLLDREHDPGLDWIDIGCEVVDEVVLRDPGEAVLVDVEVRQGRGRRSLAQQGDLLALIQPEPGDVDRARPRGVAASPRSGVNTLTGEGLAEVLSGAQVVVDVSNSPSFEDKAVLDFFTTSTGNLLAAEKTAGVGHHVALSVVGTERLSESGYFRAKLAQEKLTKESPIRSCMRPSSSSSSRASPTPQPTATRFAFPRRSSNPSQLTRSPARLHTAVGEPINGTIEIAGPEQFGLDELIRKGLSFRGDPREVVADPEARYFGALIEERTLLPSANALILDPRFEAWLVQTAPQKQHHSGSRKRR